jgi:hypothetical protein
MKSCRFVEEYQGFDETCSLQLQGKGLLPWTQSWTSSVHCQFSQLSSNVIYPSHRYFKWQSHLQKVPLCKFLVSFLTITCQANGMFVFSLILQHANYMKQENSNWMGIWCKHIKTVFHHITKNCSHMRSYYRIIITYTTITALLY